MTLATLLDMLLREDPAVMHGERDDYTFCVEVALRRALWKQPDYGSSVELEKAVRREMERMGRSPESRALTHVSLTDQAQPLAREVS